MDSNTEKAAEALMSLLPNIYNDIAHPGLATLGKAVGDVLRFCALPFTAMGTIADGANTNLQTRLAEYAKKLEKIPEEKVIEVHPQIGVPVFQKLSYTTNQDIANLFINLLATASNIDTADLAHPGFENVVSQLSPDEAKIIQYLRGHDDIQYCEWKAYAAKGEGYNTLLPYSTLIPVRVKLDFPQNVHAYYANLVRLGILVDRVDVYRVSNAEYDEIKRVYDFDSINKFVPDLYKSLDLHKSYYAVTEFGRMFINACTSNE